MDRLVRIFHGGIVKENGEFEKMNEQVELFSSCSSYEDVVHRVMMKHECQFDEVKLRGRFNCQKARPHYVLMDLSSESQWNQYKEVVAGANVVCYEVVVELRLRARHTVENADRVESGHVRVENLSQECNPSQVLDEAPMVNNLNQQPDDSSLFDSFRLVDDFDPEVFDQEEEVDDDDISLGSEGEEDDSDGEDEAVEINEGPGNDDVGGHFDEPEEEHGSPPIPEVAQPTVHRHEDDTLPYTAREIALMKEVDVVIPPVRNDKDVSMCHKAVCNFQLPTWEVMQDVANPSIKKGMKFSSLDELKFFLADYVVRVFRPFTVVHSDRNLRYDVMCRQG
ncbi:unnamed protein product [Urochloa humidicola]